jgi:hypothetical protein
VPLPLYQTTGLNKPIEARNTVKIEPIDLMTFLDF